MEQRFGEGWVKGTRYKVEAHQWQTKGSCMCRTLEVSEKCNTSDDIGRVSTMATVYMMNNQTS